MSITANFAAPSRFSGFVLAAGAHAFLFQALTLPTGCRASRFVARPAAFATRTPAQ